MRRTQNGVDAAIIFGVVCDLGVFPENNLTSSSHHTQLRDIDFDNRAFSHHAKLGVHR